MKQKLILVGGGGHCRSCIDVIETVGTFEIRGITEQDGASHTEVLGYRVIGTDSDIPRLISTEDSFLVTVGQMKSCSARMRIYEKLVTLGARIATIVSPRAHVSRHSSIGQGTIVMHDAVVNADSSVGENCILNTKSLVEHDSTIGNHCHISTGALVNGRATVKDGTFCGSGSILRENVTVGERCIVGAHAYIHADLPPGTTVRG